MAANQMEILSPAGSLATLKAAVNNGADAVYIGGRAFSARKNATNFSNEEIEEAITYAHLYGAKVYVAVNTLVCDDELSEVYDFVKFLYYCGADALIIQDLGVLKTVKEYFPDFEVHASTQMTVHNMDGAILAKELGFKRVVLSRELSFKEIKNISENVDIELEVFVHGALCMSYSGQCLMSSFIGGRSGNRGACAQPCRLPYTLLDSNHKAVTDKDKYLLSLKDLCLIDEMEALKDCGVTSLKIEGRMKSTEYVSLVTHMYNKYRNGGKVAAKDYKALKTIFSRSGFTKGYLENNTGRHMLNYEKNNDAVYDSIDPDVLKLAEEMANALPHRIPFDARVHIAVNTPMSLTVSAMNKTLTVKGSIPAQKALKVSLDAKRVKEQIAKSGSTPFELGKFEIDMEEGISLPIKEINDLRRRALEELVCLITEKDRRHNALEYRKAKKNKPVIKTPLYVARVLTVNQAKAALEAGFDKVAVPYGIYRVYKDLFQGFEDKTEVVLPPVMRDNVVLDTSVNVSKLYASNISQLKTFAGKNVGADFRLNCFNTQSLAMLKDMGASSVCLSSELNLGQISEIGSDVLKELVVYGRIPLMTVQNCLVKSGNLKCGCKEDVYYLKDRKGIEFPLYTDKDTCTNIIYNSAPLYMADRLGEIPEDIYAYHFIFTVESEKDIKDIYQKYRRKEKSKDVFTRGHYYRGV